MLTDELEDVEGLTTAGLLDRYLEALADVIVDRGVEVTSERTGLDPAVLEGVLDDDPDGVTVADAATVLALDDPDRDVRDVLDDVSTTLMVGMTAAVLDVDTVAAELGDDLTPTEVQQKLEGRAPMSLEEYAAVRLLLAKRRW